MFVVGRVVVALGAALLLAGCTALSSGVRPSPSPDQPIAMESAAEPARTPLPSPQAAVEGAEFITVDTVVFGLRPGTGPRWLETWAEQYCALAGLSPCTGIDERSEAFCIERWDCHPALVVDFDEGPAAFVFGGVFPNPVVYAVWRAEDDLQLAAFGGARHVLESYLLTVNVCPDAGGGYPRGPTCPSM